MLLRHFQRLTLFRYHIRLSGHLPRLDIAHSNVPVIMTIHYLTMADKSDRGAV